MRTFLQYLVFGVLSLFLVSVGFSQDEPTEPADDDGEVSDDSDGEETTGPATWRPTGGSLFGNTSTQQQSSAGDDLTGRPELSTSETGDDDDDRQLILVFDLMFEDGITFRSHYIERFERGFAEAVQESPVYRRLSDRNRRRRMGEAGIIAVGDLDPNRAAELAQQIGVDEYLLAAIEIENRRSYRVTVTRGRAGEAEGGQQVYTATTNRVVDNVEARLIRLTREALSGDAVEEDE